MKPNEQKFALTKHRPSNFVALLPPSNFNRTTNYILIDCMHHTVRRMRHHQIFKNWSSAQRQLPHSVAAIARFFPNKASSRKLSLVTHYFLFSKVKTRVTDPTTPPRFELRALSAGIPGTRTPCALTAQ
jgi:hypothetical protein